MGFPVLYSMKTITEFIAYYCQRGKTPNQMGYPKNSLNMTQLSSLYKKYQKSEIKKKAVQQRFKDNQKKKNLQQKENPKIDEKWLKVKRQVFNRDKYNCQLLPYLPDEYIDLRNRLFGLDPCHVFGKGAYPHMKYDVDNVVTLHRLFHSRLDQYQHPFTGDSISHSEIYEWWKKIVGSKRFSILLARSKKR